MDSVAETLGELQRESKRLGLRSADAQIARISEEVQSDNWGRNLAVLASRLQPLVRDLHLRVLDELEDRFFLVIPPEHVAHYRQKEPVFGRVVADAFPNAMEDVSEAGKCLALGRWTAVVFHLMRVMEYGVQRFGAKLGIALTEEKNWQNILDEINKAIKSLDHRSPQTKAYAAAASHLYHVKIAWRNEVMHPKQTYTPEEAVAVFRAVDVFIRDLAGMV